MVGFSRASISFKGGTLLVNPAFFVPLARTPPDILVTATLPDDPGLNGLILDLQALELDSAAVQGVSMTAGFELQLGY